MSQSPAIANRNPMTRIVPGGPSVNMETTVGMAALRTAATGAVTLSAPSSITVQPNGTRTFVVAMHVDPSKLAPWSLNGGSQGGNGPLLNANEYDGYLWLDGGSANSKIHLAWQVLPHRAADVSADNNVTTHSALKLSNHSQVLDGREKRMVEQER